MNTNDDMIATAARISREAHEGQTDKAGAPYWTHPARVADNVVALYPDAPAEAVAAAFLHDVIEDTGEPDAILTTGWTADALRGEGLPQTVVQAVLAVTRLKGDQAPAGYDYYAGIVAAGQIALMVKHADITDNLNPERLAQLDPAKADQLRQKYAKALGALGLA